MTRLIDADALMAAIENQRQPFLMGSLGVRVKDLITNAPTVQVDSEPFGYFKAEPFGWTDCAETDDGADMRLVLMEALKTAINRLEKSNFELDGIGNYTCQMYNQKTIDDCKSALALLAEWEPALKVTNNGSQLSLTKHNGDYWDMSKSLQGS